MRWMRLEATLEAVSLQQFVWMYLKVLVYFLSTSHSSRRYGKRSHRSRSGRRNWIRPSSATTKFSTAVRATWLKSTSSLLRRVQDSAALWWDYYLLNAVYYKYFLIPPPLSESHCFQSQSSPFYFLHRTPTEDVKKFHFQSFNCFQCEHPLKHPLVKIFCILYTITGCSAIIMTADQISCRWWRTVSTELL